MNVLFVCRANIGRSQMAEAIFKQKAKGEFTVSSAGTKVSLDKEGNMEGQKLKDKLGAADVLSALREIGIEAGEAERNQLTKETFKAADLVMMMAEPLTWPEYVSQSDTKVRYFEITDPANVGLAMTRELRDQIATMVDQLLIEVKGNGNSSS